MNCLLVMSMQDLVAIISINLAIELTPRAPLTNHTSALLQSYSFLRGTRYSGPDDFMPSGRLDNSLSRAETGHFGPPISVSLTSVSS